MQQSVRADRGKVNLDRVINFMAWRHIAMAVSVFLMLASVGVIAFKGLNLSLEFTGGNALEYAFRDPVNLEQMKASLQSNSTQPLVIAYLGSEREVIIRTPPMQALELEQLDKVIRREFADNPAVQRRLDIIGPQVGNELAEQAVYAILVSLVLLLAYVSYRYQYKFAVGAIAALAHDALIVVGAFALFGWEFSLTVLAAVMTVIGYSLNDTIVIFDRIRENLKRLRGREPFTVINISLTQTLERTLITVLTTMIVVLALFFMGGEVFRGFSIALIIGLVVGTYSSVYIASNILLMMNVSRQDLLMPEELVPQQTTPKQTAPQQTVPPSPNLLSETGLVNPSDIHKQG